MPQDHGTPPRGPVTLLWCDIIRDGGSYECGIRSADADIALLLEVEPWIDRTESARHKALHIARGTVRADKHTPNVPAGSDAERGWLRLLEASDTSKARNEDVVRLRQMLAILRARLPQK